MDDGLVVLVDGMNDTGVVPAEMGGGLDTVSELAQRVSTSKKNTLNSRSNFLSRMAAFLVANSRSRSALCANDAMRT